MTTQDTTPNPPVVGSRRPEPDDPMYAGLRLGGLFGVELRLDWSLFFIFVLITLNLASGLFPFWHPEWSLALRWATGAAAAAVFLSSVLVHELAHALAGRAQGIRIERITLFMFGGMAQMKGEPKRARAEFLMAIVGPLTSLAIGFGATVLAVALGGETLRELTNPEEAARAVQSLSPPSTLLLWIGQVNIALAVFNLVPGFPLDGGRVLRSILWGISGDFIKATRWAARCGLAFAWLLMGLGLLQVLNGSWIQGVWLALIGWFLHSAARMSYAQVLLHGALVGVPVARLMRAQFTTVSPELTIDAFVQELMASDQRTWPVVHAGRWLGLVGWDDVRRVPHVQWGSTLLIGVMTPRARVATLAIGADAETALELFSSSETEVLPVADGDRLVGLLRRGDLLKWYALQQPEQRLPGDLWPAAR